MVSNCPPAEVQLQDLKEKERRDYLVGRTHIILVSMVIPDAMSGWAHKQTSPMLEDFISGYVSFEPQSSDSLRTVSLCLQGNHQYRAVSMSVQVGT